MNSSLQRTGAYPTHPNLNALRDTLTKSLGPFPVEAATACSFTLHLDAKLIQNDIRLYWQNSGNTGYTIERSYDGAVYTAIAFVPGKQGIADYSFQDKDVAQEKNYYRLRQDFANGKVNYSNTILINDPINTKDHLLLFLNNPVHDNIDIRFGIIPNVPGNILPVFRGTAEINLFDMSGRITHKSSHTINRFQSLRIPAQNIPPGLYVLQLFLNKKLYVKKIVKI